MKPHVDIILDGELCCCRMWQLIPRVGEIIILEEGKIWAEVQQVLYADDSKSPSTIECQWIQVICKRVKSEN